MAKFVLTVVATIVLLFQLGNIEFMRDAAADTALSSGQLREERTSLLVTPPAD